MVVKANDVRNSIPDKDEREREAVIYEKVEDSIDYLIRNNENRLGDDEKIEYWIGAGLAQSEIEFLEKRDNNYKIFSDLRREYKENGWDLCISLNDKYVYNSIFRLIRSVNKNINRFNKTIGGDAEEADYPLFVKIGKTVASDPLSSSSTHRKRVKYEI